MEGNGTGARKTSVMVNMMVSMLLITSTSTMRTLLFGRRPTKSISKLKHLSWQITRTFVVSWLESLPQASLMTSGCLSEADVDRLFKEAAQEI